MTAIFPLNVELRVGFLRSQYHFNESDGQAAVEIVLTGGTTEAVTVLVRGGGI